LTVTWQPHAHGKKLPTCFYIAKLNTLCT